MRQKCRGPAKGSARGSNLRSATATASSSGARRWVIRDGSRKIRTGCAREDREGAERALAEYIACEYQVPRERGRHPAEILVLDVLNIYLADIAKGTGAPGGNQAARSNARGFWQPTRSSDVNGQRCRDYVAWRVEQPWKSSKPERTGRPARLVTEAAARRELEDLRAAINHHRREGLCSEVVSVVLPEKSEGRDVWRSPVRKPPGCFEPQCTRSRSWATRPPRARLAATLPASY